MKQCASPMCDVPLNFSHQCEARPVGIKSDHGFLFFCSDYCKDDWVRMNSLIKHAAEGKPLYNRRPSHMATRHWYDRDDFQGDG